MKRCKKCGKICTDQRKFCNKCGADIKEDFTYICNHCGRIYDTESTICPKCHTKPDIPLPATTIAKAKENQTPKNFCPKCGAPLSERNRFCGNCGTKIDL